MFNQATEVVEIGASHVAFARFARGAGGNLRLRESAMERIGSDAIFEPAWRESVATALQALRTRAQPEGEVTLVLPPHLTLTKFVRVPRVDDAKRERILQFEAQQAFPLALGDLLWDGIAAGETDTDCELMLSAVKRENIAALNTTLTTAGFAVQRIVPALAALQAGYRLACPAGEPPTLLFDVGARSVVVLLLESRRFCGRSFALGGPAAVDQLTTEILALRLKQETTRTLIHFGRQTAEAKPLKVVLTGGGSQAGGFRESVAEKFGLPATLLDLSGAVEAHVDVVAPSPLLALLAGAAALDLLSGQPALDLRPPEQQRETAGRRRRPWLVTAGAVVALGLLPLVLHCRALGETATRKVTAIERELAPVRARDAAIRASRSKLDETRRQVAELRQIVARRSAWLGFLADLQERLTTIEDAWFEKMKVLPPSTAAGAPAAAAAPLRLAITGGILDRANPRSEVGDETYRRARSLLMSIASSPHVAAIEGERFDHTRPGLLRFDFVLVAKSDTGL